ncbi:MAG: tRNA lysidine(34) synthetase TilS, partial [Pseudomonadota bacterium]
MTADPLEQRFAESCGLDWVHGPWPQRFLIACSGGGDSVALLHLAARVIGSARLAAATVDHGLRDVTAELSLVARHCAELAVPHTVLTWQWDGHGNLQAAARDGRRHALAAHAEAIGADLILQGHTLDDQAETVLMRLARGSGVDGLAGIPPHGRGGWLRPLLGVGRSELRAWLRARDLDWAEDPSNDDPRYDRVKVRQTLPMLAEIGITPDRLAATAEAMSAEAQT